MKKIEVRPEKVRGMGNLIPPLSVSDFELSDCMIHEEDPFKINGHLFNHFSIDVPVVPVNLVLSTDVATIYPDATTPNTAVITATLTDSSGAPVSNVDVYFQENNSRIGTASTNAQGICTFEYSSSVGGTHTIRAYTTKQARYNKSSAEINVNVYIPTSLTLSPASKTVNTVDVVSLTSKITDQTGLPVPNKLINLYYLDKVIKSARSDNRGVATFNITYQELGGAKTNTILSVSSDKTIYDVGDYPKVTVTLKDANGNPLSGKTITDNLATPQTAITDNNGQAIFTYIFTAATTVFQKYTFAGDSNYNESTTSILLKAEEPAPSLELTANYGLVGESGDNIPFVLMSEGSLERVSVSLINSDDGTVYDTATIENDGEAYFTYTCTGAGDVSVKVKYISGTNVYYSNILQIEDCIKHGFKASDTWINPSGYSSTNNTSNGVFSSTSNSNKGDSILQLDITGDFIITYEAQWQASTRCGIGAKDTTRTTHFDSGTDSNFRTQKYIYWNGTKETETHYSESTQTTYCPCKIIKSNGHLKGYMNDTLVCDLNYDWISQCSAWNLHTTIWGSGRTINIKNLKIKPYSE